MRLFSSMLAAGIAAAAAVNALPVFSGIPASQACAARQLTDAGQRRAVCTQLLGRHLSSSERALALAWRGTAAMEEGDTSAARADFDGALALEPRTHLALINRALILAADRHFDFALEDLGKSLGLGPDMPDFYAARAFVHFQRGALEDAADDAARLEMLRPGNAWAHHLRGQALARLGQNAEAAAELKIAGQLAPENPGFADDASSAGHAAR